MSKCLPAVVVAILAGCGSQPKIRLGIAAQQSPSQMLVYLARDLGYFGPDVHIEEFSGSSKAVEALVGGSLDVVSGYHEQTMALPAGSPKLVSFVAMTNGHLVALISTGGKKDLKGKPVGVTSLGSATQLFLNFALARQGLKPEDVQPVAIGTAARAVAAIRQGTVDAAVVSDFTVRELGNVTILMDARSPETARETYGVDQYPGTVLFAKKEWIDANGAQARRLADAIRKAYAWVRSHSTAEVAARLAGQREDVIASTTAMLTPDGRFTAEGVEAARKLAASPADAATSYTNEFIARERIRIAIGGQTQLVYLPTTLAQQLGYYADEGIEVELQDFAGGSKALEALFGGSADVVSGFYDHIAQMAGQGKQLKPFVSMLRYPGLALIAAPGKHVASVRELKGKIVGVSSAGSSTHNLLNHLLKKEGLSPDSVSVVGVGMAAGSVAAMESGTVDAAVMAEPAITQLKARKGELHVLADTRTQMGVRAVYGVDTYPAAVLYSKKEWVESNPETARKLTRAIVRTLAWIQTHSGEQIAAKMPDWLQGQGEVIERSKAMYSIDGALP